MLQPPAKNIKPMRFEYVQCKEQSKSRGPFQLLSYLTSAVEAMPYALEEAKLREERGG